MPLSLKSSIFQNNGPIPSKYTCEDQDVSPPLEWSNAPSQTKSFVLIVDDPDAPDPAAPTRTYVHWLLYNLPANASQLMEGIPVAGLPQGTLEGINDWGRTGYGGPCPPIGEHRYFFKLYALDTVLPDLSHPKKDALEKAMGGHVLESAVLIGTYKLVRKKS